MKVDDSIHLYGIPFSERLYLSPADSYETQIEPFGRFGEFEIEEHSVLPVRSHMPHAQFVIDSVLEWIGDNGGLSEDGFDAFYDRVDEEVEEAFNKALEVWASKVPYRMANKVVATHKLVVPESEDVTPLLNGVPLYVKNKEEE